MKLVIFVFLFSAMVLELACTIADTTSVENSSFRNANISNNSKHIIEIKSSDSFPTPTLPIETPNISPKSFDFVGCWLGDKGGGLDIGRQKLIHLTESKKMSFSYKIVPSDQKNGAVGVLLEILNTPKLEFLKKFVNLKYEGKDATLGKDKILLRGYENFQDYLDDKFATSEYFYKDSCQKLR